MIWTLVANSDLLTDFIGELWVPSLQTGETVKRETVLLKDKSLTNGSHNVTVIWLLQSAESQNAIESFSMLDFFTM